MSFAQAASLGADVDASILEGNSLENKLENSLPSPRIVSLRANSGKAD